MSEQAIQQEFAIDQVWTAIQQLLAEDLGGTIDVDCIGTQDFDEDGELTISPPAARVLFIGETAKGFESQNQSYNAEQAFAVLCADEDLGPDPQDQRIASVKLAGRVKHVLTGARLQLADGEQSEPVLYVKTDPLPTSGTGMAYVAQFLVGGIAQFSAPNASPEVQ